MSLESALQRALGIRLNLQISLSQLPIVEERMDIHLDRWLEHNPTPADMPNAQGVEFMAMLGSDLQRVWWGAWGDPRGFVPKMADYFALCLMAKSDSVLLDQIGTLLEPKLVGSWIGVWGGKVTTGWHFCDPLPWEKVESMFGTHEAKYQLKKWVDDHGVERIERFAQSIGDSPFSEIELAVPGKSADEQVATVSKAFEELTGAPLSPVLRVRLAATDRAAFGLSVRIRNGKVVRVGALAPGVAAEGLEKLCGDAAVGFDPKLPRLVHALGRDVARIEYARAGDRAGLDVYVEPTGDPPKKAAAVDEPGAN